MQIYKNEIYNYNPLCIQLKSALNQPKPKPYKQMAQRTKSPHLSFSVFLTQTFRRQTTLLLRQQKKSEHIALKFLQIIFLVNLVLKPQPLLSAKPLLSNCPNLKNSLPFHIFQGLV